MTEAWMKRSSEQQQFVDKLERRVRDAAEESGNYELFIVQFLIALLQHFRSLIGGAAGDRETNAGQLLMSILEEIQQFSRVESEKIFLAHRLYGKLNNTLGSWATRQYQSDGIRDPQSVFGAPSAMSEIKDD